MGESLQSQRTEIIQDLDEAADFLDLNLTIVFDAQYHLGLGTRSHYHSIEICFTDEGETADDYILQALKFQSKPHQITVVTSDKKLAWQARRRLAKTESVEQFLSWLSKRYQNKQRRVDNPQVTQKKLPEISAPEQSKPQYTSEMDRWQKIFEERFRQLNE